MFRVPRWFLTGLLCLPTILPTILEPVSLNPLSWFSDSKQKPILHNSLTTYIAAWQKCSLYPACRELQRICTQEARHVVHYMQKHPVKTITCGCIVAALGYLRYIKKLEQLLQDDAVWAVWKRDVCPLQKRQQYDAEFAHELLHTIQVRYMDIAHLEDFVGPVQHFMRDIDRELHQMQQYMKSVDRLRMFGLQRLVDMQLYETRHERIARLEMLKQVCLQWISKAKLEQAQLGQARLGSPSFELNQH